MALDRRVPGVVLGEPGALNWGESLAWTGRATVRAALGLTVVGLIESVCTPSGLST